MAKVQPEIPLAGHDSAAENRIVSLQLELGPICGEGTSGHCSPLLNTIDNGRYVVKEVDLQKAAAGSDAGGAAGSRERILNEVRLHRLASEGCGAVVRYAFAQIVGEVLLVCMEACDFCLWDALVSQDAGDVSGLAVGHGRPLEALRLALSEQICSAVRYCHSLRVMHRDINPWNVLLVRCEAAGLPLVAKLGDFGLAARLPPDVCELRGADGDIDVPMLDASALGSIYSAPELGRQYGLAADVFSVGMTLLALWLAASAADEDGLILATETAKQVAADGKTRDQIQAALAAMLPGCFEDATAASAAAVVLPALGDMLQAAPEARPGMAEAYDVFARACAVKEQDTSPLEKRTSSQEADRPCGTKQSQVCDVFARKLGATRLLPWSQMRKVIIGTGLSEDVAQVLRQGLAPLGTNLEGEDPHIDYRDFLDWLYSDGSGCTATAARP